MQSIIGREGTCQEHVLVRRNQKAHSRVTLREFNKRAIDRSEGRAEETDKRMVRCPGSGQRHEIMTSSRPGGVMGEVLFLWLMRAVAMGGGPFVPQPNSSAVPVGKPGTAGTVVRQRGSQETKYPNFSLLLPSYLLPLAKPEARGPRNLVMKTSEVSLTP